MKGLVPRAHSLLIEFRFVSEFLEEAPVVNGSFNTSIWRIPKSKVPGYSQRLVEDRKPRKLRRILTGPSYDHGKTSQNKFAIVAPSFKLIIPISSSPPSTSHIRMNPLYLKLCIGWGRGLTARHFRKKKVLLKNTCC